MAALPWSGAWFEAAKSGPNTRVKQTVKIGIEPNAQSPPQAQTKPVLRFRNVWLTLNKTMLCFYTSCFQRSLQAEIQKYGRQIYVCTISGPA